MNSVLMQGVGPAATTAGAPVVATGDFLSVLAEALAPSAPTPGVAAVATAGAAPAADPAPVALVAALMGDGESPDVSPAPPAPDGEVPSASTVVVAAGETASTSTPATVAAPSALAAAYAEPAGITPALSGAEVVVTSDSMGHVQDSADPVELVPDDTTTSDRRGDPSPAAVRADTARGSVVVVSTADLAPFTDTAAAAVTLAETHGRAERPFRRQAAPLVGHRATRVVDPAVGRAAFAAAAEAVPTTSRAVRSSEQPAERTGAVDASVTVAAAAAAVSAPAATATSTPATPVATTTAAPSSASAAPTLVAAATGTLLPSTPLDRDIAAPGSDVAPFGAQTPDDERVAATDRPEAGVSASDDPAAVVAPSTTPAPFVHTPVAGPLATANPVARPAGLGMIGTDRVDRVRQHTIGRPVQRLTVDIDDARVAVRVRGDRVSVDVLRDPDASLSRGWATDVERTLESAMRAQEFSPTRAPVERDRVSSSADAATRDRQSNRHSDGTDGRGDDGRSGQERRREVPWWLTEEDQ